MYLIQFYGMGIRVTEELHANIFMAGGASFRAIGAMIERSLTTMSDFVYIIIMFVQQRHFIPIETLDEYNISACYKL